MAIGSLFEDYSFRSKSWAEAIRRKRVKTELTRQTILALDARFASQLDQTVSEGQGIRATVDEWYADQPTMCLYQKINRIFGRPMLLAFDRPHPHAPILSGVTISSTPSSPVPTHNPPVDPFTILAAAVHRVEPDAPPTLLFHHLDMPPTMLSNPSITFILACVLEADSEISSVPDSQSASHASYHPPQLWFVKLPSRRAFARLAPKYTLILSNAETISPKSVAPQRSRTERETIANFALSKPSHPYRRNLLCSDFSPGAGLSSILPSPIATYDPPVNRSLLAAAAYDPPVIRCLLLLAAAAHRVHFDLPPTLLPDAVQMPVDDLEQFREDSRPGRHLDSRLWNLTAPRKPSTASLATSISRRSLMISL
ncbi:hypothetical protein LTR12_006308 [Friedmanniomyces endolithicus]|nr:hypothetical protein LTR74_000818 [Friedmanniomyces endolithicus]KAK1819239.1 hypothetical protein LTR12_006308 [Friedmanniomyces endolithicus]